MIAIPKTTAYTLKEGQTGIVVYSIQKTCDRLALPCAVDMAWGTKTTAAVKALQTRLRVVADGVFGPASQGALADFLCNREEASHDFPENLLSSKVAYESGGYLGAVNWMVAGGVDCGITQRRVYDQDYADDAVVKRAFDPIYQLSLSGNSMSELYDIFRARPGTKGNREMSWRLAVLNHNYPTLADRISRSGISGLTSYYLTAQTWVTSFGIRFPDGAPIRTPLEWGQRYSLGNPAHNERGQAVKSVVW